MPHAIMFNFLFFISYLLNSLFSITVIQYQHHLTRTYDFNWKLGDLVVIFGIESKSKQRMVLVNNTVSRLIKK